MTARSSGYASTVCVLSASRVAASHALCARAMRNRVRTRCGLLSAVISVTARRIFDNYFAQAYRVQRASATRPYEIFTSRHFLWNLT